MKRFDDYLFHRDKGSEPNRASTKRRPDPAEGEVQIESPQHKEPTPAFTEARFYELDRSTRPPQAAAAVVVRPGGEADPVRDHDVRLTETERRLLASFEDRFGGTTEWAQPHADLNAVVLKALITAGTWLNTHQIAVAVRCAVRDAFHCLGELEAAGLVERNAALTSRSEADERKPVWNWKAVTVTLDHDEHVLRHNALSRHKAQPPTDPHSLNNMTQIKDARRIQ